jgi:hypothetical protein
MNNREVAGMELLRSDYSPPNNALLSWWKRPSEESLNDACAVLVLRGSQITDIAHCFCFRTRRERRVWQARLRARGIEGPLVIARGRPGRESRCGLSGRAGEEARAQMKAMMEQFRATEAAMLVLELKVNICYLGPRSMESCWRGGCMP